MASEWWTVGALASALIAVAYMAIAVTIFRNVFRTKQYRANPLAVAMGAIFFSCAVGHGMHFAHLVLPFVGLDVEVGLAARAQFSEWHVWGWDLWTGGVAVWYWTLRKRYPALLASPAMFEDMRAKQRQALELNDNIVQGLARAQMALDLDRPEEAREQIERTLGAAKGIITSLVGPDGVTIRPGDLQRQSPPLAKARG